MWDLSNRGLLHNGAPAVRSGDSAWLGAESLNPGPHLAVEASKLQGAIARVAARVAALPGFKGQGESSVA